jgi:hypothetical protein
MIYKKACCIWRSTIKIFSKWLFLVLFVGTCLGTALPSHSEQIVVSSSSPSEIKIKTVYKSINFPAKDKTYSVRIIGENFGSDSSKINLFVSQSKDKNGEFSEGINEKVCWQINQEGCNKYVQGIAFSNREIAFNKIPALYAGEVGIQIGISERFSNIYPIFLSPVAQEIPLFSAGLVSLLVLLLLLVLSWRLVKISKTGKFNGDFSLVKKFLIDSETNTVSLSVFQFYIWTFTAILSYLYLFFSRSLIQGKLEFIEIPSGLPGIVLISSATILASKGISNTKGSTGAGNINPQWSDLISIGGVITPERVQFLIWTILGSLAFLFIALFQAPESIKDLPQIPSGFLQLMGVSSFGYVGGKLARKAGPIIKEINAKHEDSSLVVDVYGSTLSEDAVFKIGSVIITADMIDGNKPEIISIDNSNEPSFGKHIRLTIDNLTPNSKNNLDTDDFRITNPDGQFAEWKISIPQKLASSPQTITNPPKRQSTSLSGVAIDTDRGNQQRLDPRKSQSSSGVLDPDAPS